MSTNNPSWPVPQFQFLVTIDGEEIPFQEVSGLEHETEVIEYKGGNSQSFSGFKMPGLAKVGNIILKKGLFSKDTALFDMYSKIQMNTITRSEINIRLLDENKNAIMTWKLQNAWPVKITATDLQADGNEVAVESVEIAYETLVIEKK